ncbi:MAG: Spy/CpxP family protein refolding chaperone [Deltaproteobacteria bacterium]|nr:Spy/CpxP family protein refolding chaperone [Deltaproteobacteria bacterium]
MKGMRIAGVVLSVVAFWGPMVWAGSGVWGHGMGIHRSISPEMASALNLTEDQKQILQELRDAYSNEMAPLRNQFFSKKAEMRMLWDGSSPDREKVAAMYEEISTLRQRLNQLAVQYQMDCRDVLTPDQQAKLAETATGRHRSGGKNRP